MLVIPLIVLALLSSFSNAQSTGVCFLHSSSQNVNIREVSLEHLKQDQIALAKSNMIGYCKRNIILRYLNSKKLAPADCNNQSLQQLENYTDNYYDKSTTGAWILSLISTYNSRKSSYENSIFGETTFKNTVPSDIALAKDGIERLFRSKSVEGDPFFEAKKIALCSLDSKTKMQNCRRNMDLLDVMARPHGSVKLMTPNAWKYIYSTDRIDLAYFNLVWRLKRDIQENKLDPKRNIFTDLISEFEKTGLSTNDAVEATWQTLGALSNAGQNTLGRTTSFDFTQKSIHLGNLGIAMSYLDYLKLEKGWSMYSFPQNVTNHCDSAKYYHFWMAAYLARALIKEHQINYTEAVRATYLAQIGYQLNREVASNSAGSAATVTSATPFGPVQNVVRMDLAYAAAGAIFGANSAIDKTIAIDVDQFVIRLLENSHSIFKSESFLTIPFNKWSSIFSPFSILD